ncbi:nucleolar and coiled-body phosphoprotein 1-like [Branchiostoma lanceolatum]|uniref:nucleolar and coiled-body phosphoprotein 1-like n=1 Tax=Branchiostoma lanceolatum TaxID=7740 RepID=UPI003452A318
MDMNSVGKGPKERHIAFMLADALRQEDAEKFLEVYDTVIPQEMPLDEVDHIKERARELSELPEEYFQQEFRLVKQSLSSSGGDQPGAGQSGGGQSADLPEEYYQRKCRLQKRPRPGCSSVSTASNNTDNQGQGGTGTCGQALKHAKISVLEKIAKTTSVLAALESATTELTVIQEGGCGADDQEKEEKESSAAPKYPVSTRATLPSLSQLYKTAEKLKASSEQLRKMWENRESEKPPFGYPPDATSITKSAMTLLNKGETKEGDGSLDAIPTTGLERRGSLDSGKDDDRQYESSGSRRSSVSQGGRKKKKKKKKANKSGKQQSVGALKSASSECSIDSDSGTINSQDGASSNSVDSGKSNASNPEKKETDPIVIEKAQNPENTEKLTLTSNGLSKDMVKGNAARIGNELASTQQQNSTEIPLTPGTMQEGTKSVGQPTSSPWGGGMTYASKLKAGLEKFREGDPNMNNKDSMDGEESGNIVLPEGSSGEVIVPNGLPVVEICPKEEEPVVTMPQDVGGAYDNAKSQEREGYPHLSAANLEKNVSQNKGTGKVDPAEGKGPATAGPSEAYARKVCTRATPAGAVSCSEECKTLGKEETSLQAILLNFENSPFQFLLPSEVFDGPNADSAIQGSNRSENMPAGGQGDVGKLHVRVSRDFSLTPPEVPQYEFGLGNTVLPGSIGVVMMDNAAVKNVDMTKGNYSHKEDPGVHTERPPVPSVPEEITYNFQEAANYLYREWEQTFKQCQEDPTKVQYYKSGLSA